MPTKTIPGPSYKPGLLLTLFTGVLLILFSLLMGRDSVFLFFNHDLGKPADYFFSFWTNMGDGAIWVLVAVLVWVYSRKHFPLLLSSIILSTLITQLAKNFIFPGVLRPTAAIKDVHLIHTVPGVELLTSFSFPSGHTAAAFTIFLLGAVLIPKKWILPIGFLYALLVGYSRVYLAEHYPLDVGGGMITAIITLYLSLQIQFKFEKNNRNAKG
ncbi:MAG: hypothetical protein RLZZ28_2533 [Bacteroidota bacterium]|jgi:membrane-associated phospholipid phosphatase